MGHTSVAHRLPHELLALVVQYLPFDGDGTIQKPGLAAASLTCRFWAKQLQPPLFRELTLRGPEDVDSLLEFFFRSCSGFASLSTHVHKITYHKTDDCIPPWLRLKHISQVAPQAKFYCVVSQSNTDMGAKVVDGNTLVHCLPRTLPPSAFPPMAHFELRDVEFTHPTRLVKFARTFRPKLEKFICASLTFQTPGSLLQLPRGPTPTPTQEAKYTKSLGVDMQVERPIIDFTTQLRFMFAIMNIRGVLLHTGGVWRAFETAIAALMPPDEVWVGDIQVGVETADSQFCSISAVGTGETIRIIFEVHVGRCGAAWVKVDTSKASEIPMTDKGWKEFEKILANLDQLRSLEVVIGENESMIESVLQGDILSEAAGHGKLGLRSASPAEKPELPASTKEDVLAVPEEQDVDGGVVKLTGAERLQLLDSQDKDVYLHGLKTSKQRKNSSDSETNLQLIDDPRHDH